MVQILPDVRLAGYPRVRGLGVDPGGNSAECFGFWTVLGIPNFQVAQEIFVDVQPNYGLWIFFSGDHWIGHLHFWSRFAVAFQLDSLLHRIDALHFPVFLKQVCHKTLPFSEGFCDKSRRLDGCDIMFLFAGCTGQSMNQASWTNWYNFRLWSLRSFLFWPNASSSSPCSHFPSIYHDISRFVESMIYFGKVCFLLLPLLQLRSL